LYVVEMVQALLVPLAQETEAGLPEPLQHDALAHVARTVQVKPVWMFVDTVEPVELVPAALQAWDNPALAVVGADSGRVAVVTEVVVVDKALSNVMPLFALAAWTYPYRNARKIGLDLN
jgi:hypothetical protein